MKHLTQLLFVVLSVAVAIPAFAFDVRIAAGGLARDEDRQVVQLGVDMAGFQPTYTAWHEQRAASLLYAKRWQYFELAGGPAYVSPEQGDAGIAAHVRLGPRIGPFFVVYETLIHDGRATNIIMGGVQFHLGR